MNNKKILFLFLFLCFINITSGDEKTVELLAKVKINGKYGYIDTKGNFIIKPQYDKAYSFSEGKAAVSFINSNKIQEFIYIDPQNTQISKKTYLFSAGFREGFAVVETGTDEYGFINNTGELIKENFSELYPFYNGYALALDKKNNTIGYINPDGNWILSYKYKTEVMQLGIRFQENLAVVVKKIKYQIKYGYINKKGEEVIPCRYDKAFDFSESLAGAKQGAVYGFINPAGQWVIPPQFDEVDFFHEGLCSVLKDEMYGFIDKSGKLIIPYQFDTGGEFHEDLACVKKEGLYGYINKSGVFIISPQFEQGLPFYKGLAAVVKDGKVGYINKQGEFIIKPLYDVGQNFVDINETTPADYL